MNTTTLGEIIDGFYGDETYRIYVISSGEIPLYVGQSKDAVTRILSHLGTGEWIGFYGSTFDKKIKTYPGWRDFQVELFTLEECAKDSHIIAGLEPGDWVVDYVEDKLIYNLSPVFNSKGKKKTRENSERWYTAHPEPAISMPGDDE